MTTQPTECAPTGTEQPLPPLSSIPTNSPAAAGALDLPLKSSAGARVVVLAFMTAVFVYLAIGFGVPLLWVFAGIAIAVLMLAIGSAVSGRSRGNKPLPPKLSPK